MNLSRICRLLQLISLLQGGRGHNSDALALELGVSRRTVFRDLDALRQAGIPLAYDGQRQTYGIPGTCLLPPTNFTAEEALALIVLCHDLGNRNRVPFFQPAHTAALKLESSLPLRLRDQLRSTSDAVRIELSPHNLLDGGDDAFRALLQSVLERRSVRVTYQSLAEQQVINTRLSPYQLLFSRRSWYCIGRSSLHRATRIFNVGRIRQWAMTEETYQVPRGFSLDRYLRNAWHLIPERGPDHEVAIRFHPRVAQNVAEVAWHKTQRTSLAPDGSLDFRVTVSGLTEISWWILGYGDQAEVLQPPALRKIIARHARTLAERYRDVVE
jgi:proteasome accessory factor B